MIALLLCNCAGVESYSRQQLLNAGVKKYYEPKAYKGKEACLDFLSNFPEEAVADCKKMIENDSGYRIVFGYDDETLRWVDIGVGGVPTRTDLAYLVEDYDSI